MDERVMIFIDGSNAYHCFKAQFGKGNPDFGKLSAALCEGRRHIRTYYYTAMVNREDVPDMYARQQRFLDWLRNMPYTEVKLGRLEKRPGGVVEKGVDVKLATDMLYMAFRDTYDTAIIISGDGDFADVVRAVKNLGKHVENAFCRIGSSRLLRQECDRFVEIDEELFNQCF